MGFRDNFKDDVFVDVRYKEKSPEGRDYEGYRSVAEMFDDADIIDVDPSEYRVIESEPEDAGGMLPDREWKFTLLRSNPQVFRQVVLPGDLTFSRLGACYTALFYPTNAGEIKVSDADSGEIFPGDEPVSAEWTLEDMFLITAGRVPGLILRAELLDTVYPAECEERFQVTRMRGRMVPARRSLGIREVNQVLKDWETYESAYLENVGHFRKSDYDRTKEQLEAAVRKVFANEKPADLQLGNTDVLTRMFEDWSPSDLRRLIDQKKLPIRSTNKNGVLAELLTLYGSEAFAQELLGKLGLTEFEALEALVLAENGAQDGAKTPKIEYFPVLFSYGLVREDWQHKVFLLREFAEALCPFMGDAERSAWERQLKLRLVLKGCMELYGIFGIPEAACVMEQAFPEEGEVSVSEWESAQNLLEGSAFSVLPGGEIFYDGQNFRAATASVRYPQVKQRLTNWYLPERAELESLADGRFMPDHERKALNRFLYNVIGITDSEFFTAQLEKGIHLGIEIDSLVQYVFHNATLSGRPANTELLKKRLTAVSDGVRSVRLCGYNRSEFERRNRGSNRYER